MKLIIAVNTVAAKVQSNISSKLKVLEWNFRCREIADKGMEIDIAMCSNCK